jgi:hypothetical protein
MPAYIPNVPTYILLDSSFFKLIRHASEERRIQEYETAARKSPSGRRRKGFFAKREKNRTAQVSQSHPFVLDRSKQQSAKWTAFISLYRLIVFPLDIQATHPFS